MILNTNVRALNSLNALRRVDTGQGATLKKLSSGKRVNSAADDATATIMRANKQALIRGSEQAARNAQDGMSLVQTAQGGIDSIQGMVQRMRELCIEAANDTLTSEDRGQIRVEIDQLNEQITKNAKETTFNGHNLLAVDDNAETGLVILISSRPNVQVTINRTDITTDKLLTPPVDISDSAAANKSLTTIDNAISKIASEQTKYGSYQESFEHAIGNLNITIENTNTSYSILIDADMAAETIQLAKYNILKSSTDIMLANASQSPRTVLALLRGE